jgi:hypothetical protein
MRQFRDYADILSRVLADRSSSCVSPKDAGAYPFTRLSSSLADFSGFQTELLWAVELTALVWGSQSLGETAHPLGFLH